MPNNQNEMPLFSMDEITEAVLDLDVQDAITVLSALDKIAENTHRAGRRDGLRSSQHGSAGDVFVIYKSNKI